MRSTTKTILYVRVKEGAKTTQHPVAVFPGEDAAGDYARAMHTAQKNSDHETIKALFAAIPTAADGTPYPVERFIRVDLPYSPSPFVAAEDLFGESSSDAK